MTERIVFAAAAIAAVGGAAMAGVFFIFSVAVMPALGRIAPSAAIPAMQSINATIQNPLFFVAFFGPAVASVMVVAAVAFGWPGAGPYALSAALLYLVGCILVTVLFNVPLNDALDAVAAGSADGAEFWTHYLSTWTRWNHVRMVACFGAALGFGYALL